MVTYHVSLKRVIMRRIIMGIADGTVSVDGQQIYTATDLRVGLFAATESM